MLGLVERTGKPRVEVRFGLWLERERDAFARQTHSRRCFHCQVVNFEFCLCLPHAANHCACLASLFSLNQTSRLRYPISRILTTRLRNSPLLLANHCNSHLCLYLDHKCSSASKKHLRDVVCRWARSLHFIIFQPRFLPWPSSRCHRYMFAYE